MGWKNFIFGGDSEEELTDEDREAERRIRERRENLATQVTYNAGDQPLCPSCSRVMFRDALDQYHCLCSHEIVVPNRLLKRPKQ